MRIRTLKPEILTDEKTAGLTDTEWRLFVSCIVMSDDYGAFRASPAYLHSQAFWSSATSREDVAKARDVLAKLSLVDFYEVSGQQYGRIAGWSKHQRVDKPGKPLCPPKNDDSRESREDVAKARGSLVPDQEIGRDQEKEGKGVSPRDPSATTTDHEPRRTQISTASGLIHWLRIAIESAQPQAGIWNAGGTFAASEARGFLESFGDRIPEDEIHKRIDLFAADQTMSPWTVKKFVAMYNGIGQKKHALDDRRQYPHGKPISIHDIPDLVPIRRKSP